MSETIKLVGGPKDGETFGWDGGDWFYCVSMDAIPAPLAAVANDPVPNQPLQHHEYRRSAANPSLFLYQEPRDSGSHRNGEDREAS